jgi:hypothetical protein
MGELLKIKGPIETIEEKMKNAKGVKHPERFKKVVEHFKIVRKYLKNFGVGQIECGDLQGGTIIFDFG